MSPAEFKYLNKVHNHGLLNYGNSPDHDGPALIIINSELRALVKSSAVEGRMNSVVGVSLAAQPELCDQAVKPNQTMLFFSFVC